MVVTLLMMNLAPGDLHAGLQSVLDTALDAVVVMGTDGRVLGWNANAAAIFGWSPEEAIGRRLSELIIPPEHQAAHERGLAHYLATGEGPVLNRHIEINGCHREGHEIPVELSITESKQFRDRLFIGFCGTSGNGMPLRSGSKGCSANSATASRTCCRSSWRLRSRPHAALPTPKRSNRLLPGGSKRSRGGTTC